MDEFPTLKSCQDNAIITINNSSFSIGRSLCCDHIIQSLGVSRFHCIIKKSEDKWTLFDRSTNGTVVNSTVYKNNASVELKNGDVIKLGSADLAFVFNDNSKKGSPESDDGATLFPGDELQLEEAASELAAVLEQQKDIPTPPLEQPPKPETSEAKPSQDLDIMENELTCSICSELFIKAVTLNCSHTFCKFCLEQWKKHKFRSSCPICRQAITTTAPTLVLDNFIDKIISTQSDEVKEGRKELIKQREEACGSAAGSSSNAGAQADGGPVIEIHSQSDDSDMDHDYEVDYDNYSDYYNESDDDEDFDDDWGGYGGRRRTNTPYYGGYGNCYICHQPGHWANSCPFKN